MAANIHVDRPLDRAGLVLGIGLGGFADGIILHQLLQWHHLVCTTATCEVHTLEEFKRQTFQDGLFHLAMWITVIVGVVLLFRATARATHQPSGKSLFGSILMGWAVFNLVEGIINHHILGLHHVISGSRYEMAADLAFLAVSVVLLVIGIIVRSGGRRGHLP